MTFDHLYEELARIAAAPRDAGRSLMPEFYTSEEWLAHERAEIFRREWICVGRADELPAVGDYSTAEIDGAPIIVLRRADGRLGAMSAACLHRMALIAEGAGHARGFKCPYHGWTYDLEGRLIGAPRMPDSFDRAGRTLPRLALEEWNGFVYVNLDSNAKPLAPRLEGLARHLAPYHIERMRVLRRVKRVWRTNWKILAENFLEPYHLNETHTNTLATFAPPSGVNLLPEADGYQFYAHRMTAADVKPVPLDPRIGIENSDLTDDNRQIAYIGGIFPAHLLAVTWDSLVWMTLQPGGVNSVIVDYWVGGPFAIPEGEAPDPDHPNLYWLSLIEAVNEEDRTRVEGIQRAARGGLGREGVLHPHEAPIQGFFKYLQRQLSRCVTP